MAGWTFFLATFGCKVNQYESQALREAWAGLGGTETGEPAEAEWIVLNTCAVTAQAVSDARQAARSLHRQAPDAHIVIAGCAASAAEPDLTSLPGVAAVIAQKDKDRLLARPPFTSSLPGGLFPAPRGREHIPTPGWAPYRIDAFQRSRPVLKVQDGCSHGCTYCIVPLTRGPARSRPPAEVLAEAKRLLAAGHREIMLSGINPRQYNAVGESGQVLDFWDLLRRLDTALAPEWHGRARLRISSLDPAQLGAKALDTLGDASLICPHLHLSLQSGSPAVLRRMNRSHYDPGRILDAVREFRTIWPLFGLGVDALMGFPGETPAECQETLSVLEALPLSYAHVFPYSRRPGTPAAALPDLPGPEKRERARLARSIAEKKHRTFLEQLLELPELHVALDAPHESPEEPEEAEGTTDPAAARGVTEFYAGCILPAWPKARGGYELLHVRPTRIAGQRLVVEFIERGAPATCCTSPN